MAGFSIDEVRETFEADISSFLARIEAAGNALLACNALAPLPTSDTHGFALLGDLFHTLYGTSMLVGARSLAETAGRLERLPGEDYRQVPRTRSRAVLARRNGARHRTPGRHSDSSDSPPDKGEGP